MGLHDISAFNFDLLLILDEAFNIMARNQLNFVEVLIKLQVFYWLVITVMLKLVQKDLILHRRTVVLVRFLQYSALVLVL